MTKGIFDGTDATVLPPLKEAVEKKDAKARHSIVLFF